MLGFEITLWDYLTFVVLFLGVAAFLAVVVFVLGLPGRIAIAIHFHERGWGSAGCRNAIARRRPRVSLPGRAGRAARFPAARAHGILRSREHVDGAARQRAF